MPATLPVPSQLSFQVSCVMAGISSKHSTVIFAGAEARTGAILSSIVIICVRVMAALPQASLTFHVLVMVPPQLPPVKGPSTPTTYPPASQLSVHARLVIAGISSKHSTVILAGAAARTGASISAPLYTTSGFGLTTLQPSVTLYAYVIDHPQLSPEGVDPR
ncbi:hypothetical protein DSECCO2_407480 [anaerobic digester metagenome]